MNIERLQKMAEMLQEVEAGTWEPTDEESIPANYAKAVQMGRIRFDMETWGAPHDINGKNPLFHFDPDSVDICGFSACAIGHALLDDRFDNLINSDVDGSRPHCGNATSWEAVIAYFDISRDTARHLFDDGNYQNEPEGDEQQWDMELVNVTPAMVRERIELLISGETTDGKA